MIFFNQSIYEFGDVEYNNVKTEKTFKRYFQINPNLIQSLIDYEKTFPAMFFFFFPCVSFCKFKKPHCIKPNETRARTRKPKTIHEIRYEKKKKK